MSSINELTTEEFISLLDQYYAPPSKRIKMSATEIKELATRLNQKIHVPLINECQEEKILIKVILKIDSFLYDNLPNEIYDLVRSADKGIDNIEAERLVVRLTALANNLINIPYIPERAEAIAIKYVIQVIINGARKEWDFHMAKDASGDALI